jgi:hypothetical protein
LFWSKTDFRYFAGKAQALQAIVHQSQSTGGIWSFIPLQLQFTDQSKVAVNAKRILLYDSSFFTYVFESNKIVYFGILQ